MPYRFGFPFTVLVFAQRFTLALADINMPIHCGSWIENTGDVSCARRVCFEDFLAIGLRHFRPVNRIRSDKLFFNKIN